MLIYLLQAVFVTGSLIYFLLCFSIVQLCYCAHLLSWEFVVFTYVYWSKAYSIKIQFSGLEGSHKASHWWWNCGREAFDLLSYQCRGAEKNIFGMPQRKWGYILWLCSWTWCPFSNVVYQKPLCQGFAVYCYFLFIFVHGKSLFVMTFTPW